MRTDGWFTSACWPAAGRVMRPLLATWNAGFDRTAPELDDVYANPDHAPIMIMIETKQQSLAEATGGDLDLGSLGVDLTEVLTFDRAAFDALEAEIESVFDRDQIITPDDIRGDAATLEEAVLAGDAWPTLDDAAGKVLFSLVDLGPPATCTSATRPTSRAGCCSRPRRRGDPTPPSCASTIP